MHVRILLFFTFISLIISCSSVTYGRDKKARNRELGQMAIFEYLKQPNIFLDMLTGKGLIQIDPLFSKREIFTVNGKIYFSDHMRSELLKIGLPNTSYSISIPDSLAGKYRLTGNDMDYEHDYGIIHQFSPLLPTIENDIYLMEHYVWANHCISTSCTRALSRRLLKFKTNGQIITFLTEIPLRNQIDFIGFGGFSRKKMDEALPNAKIIKFGS